MAEAASEDNIKRVERELAKEDRLLTKMIEQAPGMLGMAFMFVITILMGVWLQPWFDSAGLQAFGESGSTQARWVGLQLASIFAFTFVILWLAKKHLQHIIKYGLLFVLFLALCYTTIPGAHILLVPEVETESFAFTDSQEIGEEMISMNSDGSIITQLVNWAEVYSEHSVVVSKRASNTSLEWTTELDSFPGPPMANVIEGDYSYTVTNGIWIWSLDKNNGETLQRYACFDEANWNATSDELLPLPDLDGCIAALEIVENPDAGFEQQKGALYIISGSNELVRRNTFHGTNITNTQAKWVYPQLDFSEGITYSSQYDEDSLVIASPSGALMINLEEFADSYSEGMIAPPGWIDECTVEWLHQTDESNTLTAFNIIESPWESDEDLVMAGHSDGKIMSWIIDEDIDEPSGEFAEEERFLGENVFEGPIGAIDSFDLDGVNGNELWIADADGIHGLFKQSLIEYATLDVTLSPNSKMSVENWEILTISDGSWSDEQGNPLISMQVESGVFDPETMYNSYGIQWDDTAFFLGLGLSIILMVALIVRPEWYVVNTVGVLVGAGVIVMLGVTFVPTLIVIFMILAAIYDAWAVYRSKHMLDLADTMIGLNLPILLVAPQESGYSMLDEKDSIRPPESSEAKVSPASPPPTMKKRKKPKEAMFMGLGDVIFPGMLVVSCVNSISTDGLAVGISALIGGLIGYFVLMGYVASGRPQAGLPLLNGGAILGYIVGGLIFVGSAAFSFGISL